MWCIALLVGAANASPINDAAKDFKVPTFKARQLVLLGQDLFNTQGDENGTQSVSSSIALNWDYFSQSPERTVQFRNALVSDFYADPSGQTRSGSEVVEYQQKVYSEVDSGTVFYGVTVGFGAGSEAFGDGPLNADVKLSGEVGVGRVVDARTLAQAYEMFRVLRRKASAAKLHEVAEVIGQRVEYNNTHKFRADEYFYGALGKALGGLTTKQTFRVQRVLESPLYNIGSRQTGFEAGAILDNGFGDLVIDVDSEAFGRTTYGRLFANTATMVGKTNVSAYGNMGCALAEDGMQTYNQMIGEGGCDSFLTVNAGARASVDHSSSWNTTVALDLSPTLLMGDGQGLYSTTSSLRFESRMAVGSRVIWGAYASTESSRTQSAPDPTQAWVVSSDLTLFLL